MTSWTLTFRFSERPLISGFYTSDSYKRYLIPSLKLPGNQVSMSLFRSLLQSRTNSMPKLTCRVPDIDILSILHRTRKEEMKMKMRDVAFFADVNLFVVILHNGELCSGGPITRRSPAN